MGVKVLYQNLGGAFHQGSCLAEPMPCGRLPVPSREKSNPSEPLPIRRSLTLLINLLCRITPPQERLHRRIRRKFVKRWGRRFRGASTLVLLALCFCTGLLTYMVLDAFDGNIDLWPDGASDFVTPTHNSPMMGDSLLDALHHLFTVQCFVMTAGAYLVSCYRARSALATDPATLLVVSN